MTAKMTDTDSVDHGSLSSASGSVKRSPRLPSSSGVDEPCGVRTSARSRCNAGRMTESTPSGEYVGLAGSAAEPDNPRLDRYLDKTQNPLDLVALLTLWIVVVPPARLQRGPAR